jgi:hypothetical protein
MQPDRTTWKILLDTPASKPELGFSETSAALAAVILHTPPQFSVGIFGGWGSGKTTLMKAIRERLSAEQHVVTVDFNAWRFEREPLLLVPLLDTIRDGLLRWSTTTADIKGRARTAASRIGRVVEALAAGLSAGVQLPGGIASVNYDVGKGLDALSLSNRAEGPKSLYVAAFAELEQAFKDFADGGIDRVVVFVDDLDRCLPSHALDVLESMKLFFDLRGFIFVVGLDESVVERAVLSRFAMPGEPAAAAAANGTEQPAAYLQQSAHYLSREYVKKIFQVPYTLPPVAPSMLNHLLASIRLENGLKVPQSRDLDLTVRPYLEKIAVDGKLNPREVKRFINTYTLQTSIRKDLRPDVVLALQAMFFRYEWRPIYNLLLARPLLFIGALKDYRGRNGQPPNDSAFSNLDPKAWLPPDMAAYLRTLLVQPLIDTEHDLERYLSSLAETSSGEKNIWLVDLNLGLGELRAKVSLLQARGRLTATDLDMLNPARDMVSGALSAGQTSALALSERWGRFVNNVQAAREALQRPDTVPEDLSRLLQSASEDLDRLLRQVEELWAGRR